MAEIKRHTRQFVLPVSKWDTVIREGDGIIDDIFDRKGARFADLVPEWIAYHVESTGPVEKCTRDTILDMVVQDQEYLMLEIYKCNNQTSMVNLRAACEHCYEPNGVSVDLDAIPFVEPPESVKGENPVFKLTLPRSGWDCEWTYITGRQELRAVEKMERGVCDPVAVLFESITTLGPYKRDVDLKYRHVKELLALDRATLRKSYNDNICGYNTRYRWRCSFCEKPNVTNLLGQPGFFRAMV